MFTMCWCKKMHSPVHTYESPIYTNINYTNRKPSPPPIPPRRCRFIKNDDGVLLPVALHWAASPIQTVYRQSTPNLHTLPIADLWFDDSMKKAASMPCLSDESLKKLSKRLSKNTQNLTRIARSHDIEPLFTVEINIKNERTGLLSTRKIYM
jgi:hypothetical protein